MATSKKMDTEGVFQRYDPKAIEDDVEGHRWRRRRKASSARRVPTA